MWKTAGHYLVAALASLLLIALGFSLGVTSASRLPSGAGGPQITANDASSTPDLSLFWETWNLVNQKYLNNSKIPSEDKVRGAAAGLVASLGDPYSEFFSPKDAASFQEDVTGNFGGIGAELGIRNNVLTVVTPLKDSPAAAAGLKSGDQILLIDATSTQDMSVEQAVDYIRGPENTPIKLTIMRKGWDKPQAFTLVRKQITAPTLDFAMKPNGIAYIQLYQFNANAERLFLDAIRKAALQGANGVVLDLRGNPGGYLDVAVDLAGWFVPRGTVVVSQQGRNGIDQVLRASGNDALQNVPVVILIDSGSASAAEILAGALRDIKHAPLVGETSFGKGTVQELEDLPDGSLVKLTIAHWVLPSGHILENGGLKPDYEVKLSDDDVKNGKDPQLDKALEIMRQKLGVK